jgi:hypothetical protein
MITSAARFPGMAKSVSGWFGLLLLTSLSVGCVDNPADVMPLQVPEDPPETFPLEVYQQAEARGEVV